MTFWQQGQLAAVPRDVERLIRGDGLYVRDVPLDGEAHGCVLRSPFWRLRWPPQRGCPRAVPLPLNRYRLFALNSSETRTLEEREE